MTSLQQKQETICINLQWVVGNRKKAQFFFWGGGVCYCGMNLITSLNRAFDCLSITVVYIA